MLECGIRSAHGMISIRYPKRRGLALDSRHRWPLALPKLIGASWQGSMRNPG